MSNAAILYLRLLRRIVRESAWRLGGADEIFLASGLSGSDTSASPRPVERDGRCTRPVGHDKQRTPPVVCGGAVERDNRAGS
ncbi:MAG: hypothetical protein F4X08_00955 [Gemmatimonadetes bacterium]|nr:hypothetical protein [Gemmatimonadota bacterium]MYD24370.1 hypothetical protein [Gemmatimonadota bacterium]MYJ00664.1 hypothetical protein [Gemmatimonadota bacterium]